MSDADSARHHPRATAEPQAGAAAAGGTATETTGPLTHIASALRRERQRAGMSLTELARRAGVAKSTLSQLESAAGNPSVETLWALSVALDVPFALLVQPARPQVQLVRAGEGPRFAADRADYLATVLSTCPPNARRDLYLITAEPGPARESDPHMPGVVEHVVLSAGRALVGPSDDPAELAPGDYIAYPGDLPHVFEALDPGTTAVLVSEHT
ncbi:MULTISPECIES: helix-turn-helix domain-containing protein [Prauserella salsuginis group]|uniref:Helix-turn-helix domain-containing protein n=1 Tax=Prauserella salsuginis TaxID=387889 RepID=A0ABW6GA75_9PSEU|nr:MULTISPECIES: XRE family transcriptional regulator [Prauserella salsuginis group]MCR3723094.1 helix-turn-helix protein [Prauserella flava]MCR3732531.1 helix-turn-helix protein [Prauserella salsuginis]